MQRNDELSSAVTTDDRRLAPDLTILLQRQVEMAVRRHVGVIIEHVRAAVAESSQVSLIDDFAATEMAASFTEQLINQYAFHAEDILERVVELAAASAVASAIRRDRSMVIAGPGCRYAIRVRRSNDGNDATLRKPPLSRPEQDLLDAFKALRGVSHGGARTGPAWRFRGYIRFAQEVTRTIALFAEVLDDSGDRDASDVLVEIARDPDLRAKAKSAVFADGERDPMALALDHAARVCGLSIKTRKVLRRYYELGTMYEMGDREFDAFAVVEPEREIDVQIGVDFDEAIWPRACQHDAER